MKYLISMMIIVCFLQANEISNKIKNDTKSDMLCVSNYPAIYKEEQVNGKKQRVISSKKEEIIKILKPNKTIEKRKEGILACYNEYKYVESMKNNVIFRINEYKLKSYLTNHNKYDLTLYENKDREFVDSNIGIAKKCALYNQGEYCIYGFGFDIVFDKDKKVKKIFLHDNSVKKEKLPFKPESIFNLYTNSKPLGLWVKKKYKKLFSKKPTVYTNNLIMWVNLSTYIKRVIITPRNGYYKLSFNKKNHYNLYKDHWNDSEEPKDYIKTIQVDYK